MGRGAEWVARVRDCRVLRGAGGLLSGDFGGRSEMGGQTGGYDSIAVHASPGGRCARRHTTR